MMHHRLAKLEKGISTGKPDDVPECCRGRGEVATYKRVDGKEEIIPNGPACARINDCQWKPAVFLPEREKREEEEA